MKTIEEINKICPYKSNEWQQGYGIWQSGFIEGERIGAKEQQQIDIERAILWLKCRSEYPFSDEIINGFKKFMEE